MSKVLDLTKSIVEKYGPARGWQFGLRNENIDVLQYKQPISTRNPLCAILIDDRKSPGELIRSTAK